MRSSLRYGLLLSVVGTAFLSVPLSFAQDNKEYLVKAAFIYNFVKFVEWPGDKAITKHSSINICILGNSPMEGVGAIFKQASTAKLSLNLVSEGSVKNAVTHCHVLFISPSEEERIGEIIATAKGSPMLTVGDMDGFIENGGMIGFVTADNKVKFEVNLKAVDAAGMRIDAQLLEIALKVIGK